MTWHKRLENVGCLLLFEPYYDILFQAIENGEKFCIRVCFNFFVVFPQKEKPQVIKNWVNWYFILQPFHS